MTFRMTLGRALPHPPAALRAPLLLALLGPAAVPTAGCSSEEDSCGPGGAPAGDVVAADTGASGAILRFRELRARANNDCPEAGAPAGVVSLTISGVLAGGTAPFTLCVPRPDLLDGVRQLGSDVQVVDVVGSDAACSYRQARQSMPSGTVTARGSCDNGRDPAGFSLEFTGEVSVERTCGAAVDTLRMSLTGKVAISKSDS